jgi:hypothetical protein
LTAIATASEHVHQVAHGERHHQQDPERHDAVAHLPLQPRPARPEVDQQHPDAVERVVDHGSHQADLHQADHRVLVGVHGAVVGGGGDAHHRGVDHVGEEEEEDQDAGDAVRDPRPHSFAAPVERPR